MTPSDTAPLYPPTVVGPPAPQRLMPFLRAFVDNPLKTVPAPVYTEPMVVLRRPGRVSAWITDPALTEEILVGRPDDIGKTAIERRVFRASLGGGILTAEGADWRWQRRAMAPLFQPAEVRGYVPAFTRAAETQLARFRTAPIGATQRVDHAMTDATFDVITETMLAGIEPTEMAAIKRHTEAFLSRISWEVAFAVLNFPTWLWHPAKGQITRASAALRDTVATIIARHRAERAGKPAAGDLLGRLIAARDPETGAGMDDARLVDNLLTLLEAGHETTAKALSWTLYLLARAPDWQERIRAEVSAVAADGPIGAEHLAQLTLTEAVLKEAMRLYPPAPVLLRVAKRPLVLGGEALPAGAMLIIPIFALHRHRKLWDDPDRFLPERFMTEAARTLPRTQYMPFGGGPRVCIGATFAMLEATAILATLVRGARFEWDGRHLPEPVSRITLRPKGGMPLRVTLL